VRKEMRQGVDLAVLMEWWNRCENRARVFLAAIAYARNQMYRRLPAHDQAQVYDLISLLEKVRKPLTPPILCRLRLFPEDPYERLFNYQKRCQQVGIWAIAALAVYDPDPEALKNSARLALGSGVYLSIKMGSQHLQVEKLPVLSRALVENHLRGWRDWRDAEDPQAWIAGVARSIAKRVAWEEAPLAFPGEEEEEIVPAVPLDDIVGTAAESSEVGATVERVYSFDALKDEARRRGDLEVLAYIEGLEAGLKHPQIRAQMGWNKFDASKIRGRFHRLRDAAAEYVTRGAISDASRTVFFETLHDGEKGREHGEWRHKDLPPKP
jgi:hypothetical protein